jgi:phage terminase large subunit
MGMIKILLLLISMVVNANQIINPNHRELFKAIDEPLWVRGGTGSGKTYSIADKFHIQTGQQKDKKLKTLVIRKTFPSLRTSTLDILTKRAEAFGLPWKLNKSDWIAHSRNHEYIFLSLNNDEDYKKLKSITDVDYIWCNEVNELRKYDIEILRTRLRGGQSWYSQLIGDFNPTSKYHWLYDMINVDRVGRELLLNIDTNPWADQKLIKFLKSTQHTNPNFYKIMFLGEWGELEGVIYNWDVVSLPDITFDEIFYGGDFGYSVDPATFIKIYRKADEFWVQELIYETGLTNPQLASKIKVTDYDKRDISYWDSAEPKSIQELCDSGITAKPAEKGPDSVRYGVDYLKGLTIHIVDGSTNIINEARSYIWKKDKDGNSLNVPMKFNDHTMDGIRYAIHTHCKKRIQIPFIFRAGKDATV